jgi:sugar lactone lactonase YvrE
MCGARKSVTKEILISVVGFSLLLGTASPVHAYERDTHREISRTAVDRSNLESILKNQYGANDGIALLINGQQVRDWIGTGGSKEDDPTIRASNHFHNPLQPWSQAGLTILGIPPGQSSVYWQQNPNQGLGGTWSWPVARAHFFDFLTKPSKVERDTALADTARALGQVIHMIQDAASPAHTRNDPHIIFEGYEARIEELRSSEDVTLRSRFESLLLAPSLFPAPSIFTPTSDPQAPVPIARLIDSDSYKGEPTSYSTGNRIGLAEYTNGGYVSDDTIFLDFALPSQDSLGPGFCDPAPCGMPGSRQYFPKIGTGDSIAHFVAEGTLFERLKFRGQLSGGFILDDKIYEDYAAKLLPRAVGYSAALINYFFRGTLDFEIEDNPTDPTQSKITITNTSTETMIGGFLLYADDANGIRTLLATFDLSLVPGEESAPQTFLPASNPAEFILVFKGQLGDEKSGDRFIGAVVAKTKKAGEIITTVAGIGTFGFSGDGGPATSAQLARPFDVTHGPDGSLYIADTFNHRIRRVGPDKIITTVAGTGTAGFSGDGGPATAAKLNLPIAVALGPDGSLYITDRMNHRIRRVRSDGIITTVAGRGEYRPGLDGKLPPLGDGGPATEAYLNFPFATVAGPDNSLYIADTVNFRIRRVGPDGIIVTVYLDTVGLSTLRSLALGPDGSLYIADSSFLSRILRLMPGGSITTVAGTGTFGFSGDGGPAIEAKLSSPNGVALGPDGSLYIADTFRIRKVRPDGIITTVAGTGNPGFSGDGGPPKAAKFGSVNGIVVGTDGSLYITDGNRVRRIGR